MDMEHLEKLIQEAFDKERAEQESITAKEIIGDKEWIKRKS